MQPVHGGSALIAQQEKEQALEQLAIVSKKYQNAKWLCQQRKLEIDKLMALEVARTAAGGGSPSGEKENAPNAPNSNRLLQPQSLAHTNGGGGALSSTAGGASGGAGEHKLAAEVRRLETENLALRGEVQQMQQKAPLGAGGVKLESHHHSPEVRRLEAENLALRGEMQMMQKAAVGGQFAAIVKQEHSEEDRLKVRTRMWMVAFRTLLINILNFIPQTIIDELELENKALREKYDGLKHVLMARNRQIRFLEAERGGPARPAQQQHD